MIDQASSYGSTPCTSLQRIAVRYTSDPPCPSTPATSIQRIDSRLHDQGQMTGSWTRYFYLKLTMNSLFKAYQQSVAARIFFHFSNFLTNSTIDFYMRPNAPR